MGIEENLRAMIIARYGNIKQFAEVAGMGYTTIHSIITHGIEKANFKNVAQICETLEISVAELSHGRIVSVAKNSADAPDLREIPVIIMYARLNPQDFTRYTLYGQPLTTAEGMMLLDALEIAVKIIKRWRDEK